MVDLLATSPDTWHDRTSEPPVIPRELIPPEEGSITDRVTALRRRHALRERRALENYAQSRKPDRGWPVADNKAVLTFFRTLLRRAARDLRRAGRAQRSCRRGRTGRAAPAGRPDRRDRRRRRGGVPQHRGTADRRCRLRPGAADLPGPADLDGLRPGPVVVGPRVHRPHDPGPAARPGRECEHRRPGHPRHPRRRHDEPLGPVRRADGDHLRADRGALDHRHAAQLRRARGAVADGDRAGLPAGAPLPAEGAEGLHQRGGDVLPHQQHPHRDGRGRPHGRGPRPGRPPGAGGRRRHRHLGAGRALHDDAAQPAVRGDRRGLQRAEGGHPAGRRLRLLPGLGLAGPDHRRCPVRRGAERPARPARRRGRPAPGGCGLDEPPARHRRGPARP